MANYARYQNWFLLPSELERLELLLHLVELDKGRLRLKELLVVVLCLQLFLPLLKQSLSLHRL